MVKLQKLVLKNFKSFRKAEIPFADGFTAIVGGNGCGKTNILDALMFALGTTSLKTLRAAKLSELVNNTAMENYAKVDLVIKHNDARYEISRMIDKQGKSVYRLNDQRKTLNEISSLLSEMGIKPNGHNIVVQGDATRIIEMSPEERRQIIDELAGLQEFDEKKVESLKNLERVETKIKDAGIVLSERENYLQSLEKDRQAALEFEKLREEKKQATATGLFLEMEKIASSRKENSDRIFSLEEDQNSLQKKIFEEDEKTGQLRQSIEELNSQILSASERTFSNFGIKAEEKKSEKMLLQQSLETKKHLLEKNNSKIFSLNEKVKLLLNEKNSREKDLYDIERELPELQEQLSALKQNKKILEEKGLGQEQFLKQLEKETLAFADEEAKIQKSLFEKKSEISSIKREIDFSKQLLQESFSELEKLRSELERKESRKKSLDVLLQEHKDLKSELALALEESKKNLLESKTLEAGILEAQKAVKELQKQIASCPVCDSKLSAEKKKSLMEKKQDLLAELNSKLGVFSRDAKKLEEKKLLLENIFEKKRELESDVFNLSEIRQKHSLLEEKNSKLRRALAANSLEQKERDAKKLEEQLLAAKAKKSAKENEARQFRAGTGFEKHSSLANSINEIQLRIGLLEQKNSLFLHGNEKSAEEKSFLEEEISQLKKFNAEMQKETGNGDAKLLLLEKEFLALQEEMKKSEKASARLLEEKSLADQKLSVSFERKNSLQQKIRRTEQQANDFKIENSKLEVRLSDLGEEFAQYAETPRLKDFADEKQLQRRVIEIEKRIAELGAINMKAVESFEELQKEVVDVRQKLGTLGEEKTAVLDLIQKIEFKRTSFFMDCFNELNKNFSRVFLELFSGSGQLSLSNPSNPLEAGLLIEAKHKGTVLKNIDSMSGGEKTLAALVFLFSIQLYEPAPFYVFDEADAALDKQNSAKMVGLIKEMSKKSQFLVITHNDPLIQSASQVIGVALNRQKSSVVGLKLKEELDVQNQNFSTA